MCIRRGLPGWTDAEIPLADFRKLVPYFDDVETIVLQGWGEPLQHPDLVPIIRAAKSGGRRPPAVGFVTSGAGLNEQLAAGIIDAGLDFIGISFAGSTAGTHGSIRAGSDYEELVHAVQALQRLRERKHVEHPRMHMVFLLLKDNLNDLRELPRLAHDLGINEVILTNLVHVTTRWQDEQKVFSCSGPADAEPAIAAAVEAARMLGISLRAPALVPRATAVCEEDPLHNLYISASGDVSPCVYLHPPAGGSFTRIFCGKEQETGQISFGNILRSPFPAIWEQREYVLFRDQTAARRDSTAELPPPPAPCLSCHKMLGF